MSARSAPQRSTLRSCMPHCRGPPAGCCGEGVPLPPPLAGGGLAAGCSVGGGLPAGWPGGLGTGGGLDGVVDDSTHSPRPSSLLLNEYPATLQARRGSSRVGHPCMAAATRGTQQASNPLQSSAVCSEYHPHQLTSWCSPGTSGTACSSPVPSNLPTAATPRPYQASSAAAVWLQPRPLAAAAAAAAVPVVLLHWLLPVAAAAELPWHWMADKAAALWRRRLPAAGRPHGAAADGGAGPPLDLRGSVTTLLSTNAIPPATWEHASPAGGQTHLRDR